VHPVQHLATPMTSEDWRVRKPTLYSSGDSRQ